MDRNVSSELLGIVDELTRATNGRAWHGPSLSEILEDVRYDQAGKRPDSGVHSIWEMALHLQAWAVEVERRLREPTRPLSPAADWPAPEEETASAWDAAKRQLFDAHKRLRQTVQQLDANILGNPLDPLDDTNGTVAVMLHGVSQHLAYHGGQISLLKRLTQ